MFKDSGVDAIMSVFIRCSELSAVKYDVEKDIIKVEIALNKSIKPEQRSKFINKCRESMGLFYKIYKLEPMHFNLSFIENSGITIVRLFRDSQTLIEDEMELFVRLLRQEFASLLIRDDNDMVAGVNLSGDEKNTLLEKIRKSHQPYQNIFAYRDEGRVFVFNQ